MVQIKENKNLKAKKTRKKWATQWINSPLMDLDSPLNSYYTNAFNCSSKLEQKGKVVTSKYCNCRTCITCNSIRTASYIGGYGGQVLSFKDAQFLTLTAPTIQCYDSDTLRYFIDARESIWRKIYENARVGQKGNIELKGIRAMEITTRPDDYYHIHFHFILDGVENAKWVKKQWLSHYPNAEPYLQVIKPITSQGGLLEVFKYGTKFIDSEKKIVDGKIVKGYKIVAPERLDLIIRGLYKKRLISTFGGIRRVKDENVNEIVVESEIEDLESLEFDTWLWVNDADWYSTGTGEKFSDFVASKQFRRVFSDAYKKYNLEK